MVRRRWNSPTGSGSTPLRAYKAKPSNRSLLKIVGELTEINARGVPAKRAAIVNCGDGRRKLVPLEKDVIQLERSGRHPYAPVRVRSSFQEVVLEPVLDFYLILVFFKKIFKF